MLGTTGTFTSCKDYDDDINNLQEQITANADAIKKLQDLVGDGKFVTGVTSDGNTITFTFSDNSTVPVTVENEQAQKVEVKNNELYIDDQPTGIKVAEEAEIEAGLVKAENGTWWVLGEDGKYTDTGIAVSGVTVVGSEKEGWELTITDAEGNEQKVKVPSAISSITDLIVVTGHKDLEYSNFKYTGEVKIVDWKGPRTLPADKDKTVYILTSTVNPLIQINPTTLDLESANITFSLVDSKNVYPTNVNLTAKAYTDLITLPTKAANANGLYSLSMNEVFVSDKDITAFESQFSKDAGTYMTRAYAVTAGGSVRSEYEVKVSKGETAELKKLAIADANDKNITISGNTSIDLNKTYGSAADNDKVAGKVNVNEWYTVNATKAAALYDMHLSVSSDDETLFGFETKEVAGKYQFRVTKTPDNITKAGFKLKIETIDNTGDYIATYVWLGETSAISSEYPYDAIVHELKADANKNYFQIDLSLMKANLGTEGTALWNTKVANHTVTFLDADGKVVANADEKDIDLMFVSEVKDVNKATDLATTKGYKNATNIMFAIKDAQASEVFKIGKQYTAVITFTDGTEDLNTITVPFTLTLPDINTLYVIDEAYLNNGVAYCYLYADDAQAGGTDAYRATFKLNRIFSKSDVSGNFKVTLDNEVEVVNKKTSSQLAQMSKYTSADYNVEPNFDQGAYITLIGSELGKEEGYDQVLSLTISGKFAGYWEYPEDEVFNFQAKIMSPIEKGKVVAKEGVITIEASDFAKGAKITNSDITGYTYNSNVTYNVLPDEVGTPATTPAWSREDVKAVKISSDDTTRLTVENNGNPTAATADDKGNITDGYFVVKATQVENITEATVKVTVTDIWNRSVTSDIAVKVNRQ